MGERHLSDFPGCRLFDGVPSLVCNIQEDEGWVKGFFVEEGWVKGILLVSQAVSCQHTGLGGLGERHLSDFPGL